MTVETTTSRVLYIGNGVQTDYNIPFPAVSETHIKAFIEELPETNFSIIGDITQPDATLSFAVAPLDQEDILILRQTPLTQDINFTAFSTYKAETHEGGFDYSMFINQELTDAITSGIVLVPLPGNFVDTISLSESGALYDPFVIGYSTSIFGGPWTTFTQPPAAGLDGIMTWYVHDATGNQRDLNLLWDGTLDIPGAIRLDNQLVPDFAEYRMQYALTTGNAPWQREYPTATGAKRDAIVAAGGLKRTFETIAADETNLVWTLDPLNKNMIAPNTPSQAAAREVTATAGYVVDALAAAGVGPDPTFNTASWEHQTSEPTFGDYTVEYDTEATIVTAEMVKHAFSVNSAAGSQGHWWQTSDAAGVLHDFYMLNDQLFLPAQPASPTAAARKDYVDSVAGGSPTPVVNTITFNYQQAGTETVLVKFDDVPALGTFPSIVWGVPVPSLNNYSHVIQTTGPTGTVSSIDFVDGAALLPKDPPSPTSAARKSYVDTGDTDAQAAAEATAEAYTDAEVRDGGLGTRLLGEGFTQLNSSGTVVRTFDRGVSSITIDGNNVITFNLSNSASSSNHVRPTFEVQYTLGPPGATGIGLCKSVNVVDTNTVELQIMNTNNTDLGDFMEIRWKVEDMGG